MTSNKEASEVAREKIRFWLTQIDGFKNAYSEGRLTKEEWLTKTKEYKIRIQAVQSVFRSL